MALNAHAVVANDGHASVSRLYAWSVFALTFGLMLSDYLTRNIISAVFPLLKLEWSLTDTQLGSLVSVVALVVGVGSFPIALMADRWGRVKSITAMAGMWCLATLGCGLSQSHTQMLVARGLVGLGEAGYASAGAAILSHVFPPRQRSAIIGSFMAAALFGSVLGVVLGGIIAAQYGWRWAFIGIGGASLALVVLYPIVVRDYKSVALVKAGVGGSRRMSVRDVVKELFASRTAIFAYLGSGLQMFIMGVVNAWMPTYLGRYYDLAPDKAALWGGVVVLVAGAGMILGGWVVDRMGRLDRRNRMRVPALYAGITFVLLTTAFLLPPGPMQLALIFAGVLLAGGHSGATGAVIIDVVHPGLRATAFAVITLGNNLIGFAPGPLFVGVVPDAYGLQTAMAFAPLACLAAAFCFLRGARYYRDDGCRFEEPPDMDVPATATGNAMTAIRTAAGAPR